MSALKRASSLPKPPTTLSSSVIISDTATLVGTQRVTVRDHSVIHPRVVISSSHAPVTIGNTCIINERAQVGLQSPSSTQPDGVEIEDFVVVEVNAVVEAVKVGLGSVIDVGAVIGKGAIIGRHCKIGPLCQVKENEILPDHTVIYGDGLRRIDKSGVDEQKLKLVSRQADILRKLISGNVAKWQ